MTFRLCAKLQMWKCDCDCTCDAKDKGVELFEKEFPLLKLYKEKKCDICLFSVYQWDLSHRQELIL